MLQAINSSTQIPLRFKSNNNTVTLPANYVMPPDTVEISGKDSSKKVQKKRMSKASKWLLGIGGTIAAFATAGILIMKHDSKQLAKLCKEKIKISQLPETIEFKEAATKEDAIKFAKETLGIKEVDETFTLEALNWTNKGLVDVSNANKGRIFVPTALRFNEMKDALASANLQIKKDCFGELCVNKQYFDDEFLTKHISEMLKRKEGVDYSNFKMAECQKCEIKGLKIVTKWTDRYRDLGSRFMQNPQNLSVNEKRELFMMSQETAREAMKLVNPLKLLEMHEEALKNAGIKYDYEAISKLSVKEQFKKVVELNNEFIAKKNTALCSIETQLNNPNQTIYHEMGHLQDFAENLEKLLMKDTEWERFKKIFKNTKNKKKTQDELEAVGSRWNKITDGDGNGKTLKDLLNEDSERFKEILPDLYEHVMNPEIQKTAGKVSEYAQKGVGEFIAEVYAEMINGAKLPDDVLALYKKYNGPLPNGYK